MQCAGYDVGVVMVREPGTNREVGGFETELVVEGQDSLCVFRCRALRPVNVYPRPEQPHDFHPGVIQVQGVVHQDRPV